MDTAFYNESLGMIDLDISKRKSDDHFGIFGKRSSLRLVDEPLTSALSGISSSLRDDHLGERRMHVGLSSMINNKVDASSLNDVVHGSGDLIHLDHHRSNGFHQDMGDLQGDHHMLDHGMGLGMGMGRSYSHTINHALPHIDDNVMMGYSSHIIPNTMGHTYSYQMAEHHMPQVQFQMPQMVSMDGVPLPMINGQPVYLNQISYSHMGIPMYTHVGMDHGYMSNGDDKCNMDFILQGLLQKGLPHSVINFDTLDPWIGEPGEDSEISDDEKERNDTAILDANEVDLRYYDVPPYKYICGGCGADYLKSQSVAAHNRACEKYQQIKEKNNGVLKNPKQDITDK